MTWESEGVLSVDLVAAAGGELPAWQPGAHLDLVVGDRVRQYSLCGSPADRRAYRIAVLHEPHGRGGSAWVHTRLRPGETVEIAGPRNAFRLVDRERYLFVAGGIGITPLLPMIRAVDAAGKPWRLVYGGRRRASMAFLGELEGYGDRVAVRPQDEVGLLDLDAEVRPESDLVVYCCGPEPLLQAVENHCAGWPPGSLKVERFAPRPATVPEEARGSDAPFAVVLARSGQAFEIPRDRTILGVLEDNGVFPLSSCLEGTCGTCETDVLEGVPDHRDSILDAQDRAEGRTMMICVSRSTTSRLVLDL